ncbi:LysR family transcriptional regulator [Raoultella sp. BIGb0138]|uniref:LysR family transcriptional regulator n=1 Tax=Raoultella sp. BIGb0138 TaxID=2485115 RepID=UPI001042C34E|nr:LysR family transcriptional regulator [Raoultella sp. BIGb0138]TCW16453.1 LysR family transcriptional regulator [Raoultella sp. BIGb0138]
MGRYTELNTFVQVAEKGSFAAAAVNEGVTPAILGRRLDALERRLGVKLMHRSTRGLKLTEAGERLLERAKTVLHEFDEVEGDISNSNLAVNGQLSVSAPAAFGRRHIAPHVYAFKQRYPELNLNFNFTDTVLDLVNDGFDMSIRIGEILDPTYVAIKLFPNQRVVCGTPEYFSRCGMLHSLDDLAKHNCLAFSMQGGQQRGWTFQNQGRQVAIKVRGDLACNDGELLLSWVKQGLGIGWRSTWEIHGELQRGELITALDEYALPAYNIQAVFPQQRYLPAKVRLFIDYLKALYQTPGYWDKTYPLI